MAANDVLYAVRRSSVLTVSQACVIRLAKRLLSKREEEASDAKIRVQPPHYERHVPAQFREWGASIGPEDLVAVSVRGQKEPAQ